MTHRKRSKRPLEIAVITPYLINVYEESAQISTVCLILRCYKNDFTIFSVAKP